MRTVWVSFDTIGRDCLEAAAGVGAEIVGVVTRADSYTQTQIVTGTTAGGTTATTIPTPRLPSTTVVTFIDRLLRDREIQDGRPGFYVACCSFGNGQFAGANVYVDRGAGYGFLINVPEEATMGVVSATPATRATTTRRSKSWVRMRARATGKSSGLVM